MSLLWGHCNLLNNDSRSWWRLFGKFCTRFLNLLLSFQSSLSRTSIGHHHIGLLISKTSFHFAKLWKQSTTLPLLGGFFSLLEPSFHQSWSDTRNCGSANQCARQGGWPRGSLDVECCCSANDPNSLILNCRRTNNFSTLHRGLSCHSHPPPKYKASWLVRWMLFSANDFPAGSSILVVKIRAFNPNACLEVISNDGCQDLPDGRLVVPMKINFGIFKTLDLQEAQFWISITPGYPTGCGSNQPRSSFIIRCSLLGVGPNHVSSSSCKSLWK